MLKCVVFLALLFSGVSSYGQQQEELKSPPSVAATVPQEKPLPRFMRPEWVIVYVTIIYSGITFFQWWTLRRQANSLDQQIQDARTANASASKTAQDTLKAIERQAESMGKQTVLLQQSTEAAKANAEAALAQIDALKSKERARVWISVEGDLNLKQGPFVVPAIYMVTQTGPTDAFVDDSFATLVVSETEPEFPGAGHLNSMNIPQRLEPNAKHEVQSVFLYKFSPDEIEQIKTKKSSVYFMAFIKYKDVFGDSHETWLMKRWRISELYNLFGPNRGEPWAYWESCFLKTKEL